MDDKSINELSKFLQLGARLDLKCLALQNILGLTGDHSAITILTEKPKILVSLISLLDDNDPTIAKDAALALINLSASDKGADSLISLKIQENTPPLQKPPQDVITTTLRFICDPNSTIADPCCMILSNLSRPVRMIERFVKIIESQTFTFDEIINIFTKTQHNKHGANLHYLGPVLSNLSQSASVRERILDREKCVIQRLLPFTEYKESLVRRGGVIGTLKNCCFDSANHAWLLSDQVDILPRLLLPLAGNEEFDDEDNDKLPLDLQYLPHDKTRDDDPDIRCMILEAIHQLCTLRENRQFIRNKNTYVILRELHKWEKDRKALLACENLVDILIKTEEEIGEDNLKEIQIPDHLHDKFHQEDRDYLSNDD